MDTNGTVASPRWLALKDWVMDNDRVRILKLHKGWADKYTLLWQVFILLLFGGIYFFLEQLGVDAAERSNALMVLSTMVLTAAIWQAAGLAIARIDMVFRGINLERPLGNTSPPMGGSG